MSRALCLLLLGCAGPRVVDAPTPPADDLEIRIDHVDLGAPGGSTGHAFLSLRNGTHASNVRVVGVQIAGRTGSTFMLGSREPSILASEDAYETWNEAIGAEDAMWIRYALERVDWDHFGGRVDQVRAISVIVEVDGRERVFSVPPRESSASDDEI